MKKIIFLFTSLVFLPLSLLAANQQVVDIDIEGMTCEFCAYSVQKNIKKLPYVEKVEVNIDTKKAHVVVLPGKKANIEQLKKEIAGAGFKPVKVTISLIN